MRTVIGMILLIISSFTVSDDGLVVQFSIIEKLKNDPAESRYTNSVLMSFPDTHSFDIPDLYQVKFQIESPEVGQFNILFTLKDLSSGKPHYVGAAPISLKGGESGALNFERDGYIYNVALDTSYGKLPASKK